MFSTNRVQYYRFLSLMRYVQGRKDQKSNLRITYSSIAVELAQNITEIKLCISYGVICISYICVDIFMYCYCMEKSTFKGMHDSVRSSVYRLYICVYIFTEDRFC